MELHEYNQKRDFKQTKEPEGKVKASKNKVIFMVQKHDATRLHFDFRIEVDGVLKSWAVPKGPPINSKDRHLAMMVEDHPYDYKDFEGTIPEGNYGAGTVMLWDEGTYYFPEQPDGRQTEKDPKKIQEITKEGIEKGAIKLYLEGKKLHGKYALIKFKRAGDNAWLMIKDKDEFEGKEIPDADLSVKTGRTLKEIELDLKPNKKVNEVLEEADANPEPTHSSSFIKPMLATLVDKSFNDKDWIFEIKWDGYRAIAKVDKTVELQSRNNILLNKDYPALVEDLKKIKDSMILDGEITVVNKSGQSEFQLLQNYRRTGEGDLKYYVFDILEYKGKDLRNLDLTERKQILKEVLKESEHVQISDHIEETGIEFFKVAQDKNLEGIIAKKKDSKYEEGIRTGNWLKIKIHMQQEVVIGGYTFPEGNRNEFGSLLLGVYINKKFTYIGNTGSGFTDASLKEIKKLLDKYKSKESPFENTVDLKNVATWVKPEIVCEVKFQNWTENNYLRQAIFLGIREDKKAKNVVKEDPKDTKKTKSK